MSLLCLTLIMKLNFNKFLLSYPAAGQLPDNSRVLSAA
jgi:hypothetical protein